MIVISMRCVGFVVVVWRHARGSGGYHVRL